MITTSSPTAAAGTEVRSIAGRELLERDHARGQGEEGGAERDGRRLPREGDAVQHPAGIDGVQIRVREAQHEGRGGQEPHGDGNTARFQLVDHARESPELPVGVGGIAADLGVRMRADAAEAQVGQLHHGEDRLDRLFRGNPEALEPHVDLDEDLARAGRRLRVRAGGVEVHEGGHEAVGESVGGGHGQRVRIHENRRGDPTPAHPDALGEVGHGQVVGAVPDEHGTHLGGPEPVAVGLDDGEDLALGTDELSHPADVVGGRVEVDLEHGRAERDGGHECPPRASIPQRRRPMRSDFRVDRESSEAVPTERYFLH